MEAPDCSKILVHVYQTVLCHIQEDSNLNVYWHQNVRPQESCTTVIQLIGWSVTVVAIMPACHHCYRCALIPVCHVEAISGLAPARSGESYDSGSRGETGT